MCMCKYIEMYVGSYSCLSCISSVLITSCIDAQHMKKETTKYKFDSLNSDNGQWLFSLSLKTTFNDRCF